MHSYTYARFVSVTHFMTITFPQVQREALFNKQLRNKVVTNTVHLFPKAYLPLLQKVTDQSINDCCNNDKTEIQGLAGKLGQSL